MSRGRVVIALVVGLALVLAWGAALRVPEGSLGFRGGEVLAPGWHVRVPFSGVPVVPAEGEEELADLELAADDGGTYPVTLTLGYRLDAEALRSDPGALGSDGLEAHLRASAESALDALGGFRPDVVLSGTPFASLVRPALEPALAAGGITLVSLDGAVSLPEDVLDSIASARRGAIEAAANPTGRKVLLIGWDGADWLIADRLMAEGRMPNLARLVREGVRADIRSFDPMISPLIWTTMATGVGPDVHGIADFLAFDEETERRVPISSRFRRVKALWNILTDMGLASGFAGWWASHPAEPVNGVLVSDLAAFATLVRGEGEPVPAGVVHPPDYLDGLRDRLVRYDDLSYETVRGLISLTRAEYDEAQARLRSDPTGGGAEVAARGAGRGVMKKDEVEGAEKKEMPRRPVDFFIKLLAGTLNYQAIGLDLIERGDLDVVSVYFESIDQVGHQFQHLMPPRHPLAPDDEYPRFAEVVDTFYAFQDRLLGDMMEAAAGRYTIMLVSDHGFRTGSERPRDKFPFTSKQPVEWHREVGVWVLSGPPARRGARVSGVTMFDITPTVLALLGLPLGEDMPGKPVTAALTPEFLLAHPERRVASWEGFGSGPPTGGEAAAGLDDAQEEMLANLAALGYITADEADAGGGGEEGSGKERTNVTYHRNLATYYMNLNRFAEAEQELRAANEIEELPKTFAMLSECLAAQGRPVEAVEALRAGLEAFPVIMSPTSVLYMVEMRIASGDVAAARVDFDAFRDRLEDRPDLSAAVEGRIAEAEGNPALAIRLYRAALEEDPTLVQTALRLWPLLEARGEGYALAPFIEAGLAREDRIDEYHNLRGVFRLRAGDLDGAVAAFERAVFLTPENDSFRANLGLALLRGGRKDEAFGVYREAVDAGSVDPRIHVNFAVLLAERGEWAASLSSYERAAELGGTFPQSYVGRATALARLGRPDEARAVAREGLSRFPDDARLRQLAQ